MQSDVRIKAGWAMLALSVVGWPLSALTVARAEPQFVLGLSWLAIILTSLDFLSIEHARKEQSDSDA